jgi:hypothetical protein
MCDVCPVNAVLTCGLEGCNQHMLLLWLVRQVIHTISNMLMTGSNMLPGFTVCIEQQMHVLHGTTPWRDCSLQTPCLASNHACQQACASTTYRTVDRTHHMHQVLLHCTVTKRTSNRSSSYVKAPTTEHSAAVEHK